MKESNTAAAKAILDQQKQTPKRWGIPEHVAMTANIVLAIMEEEVGAIEDEESRKAVKAKLRDALKEDGVGGNASQFRQGLVKAGLVPKAEDAVQSQYD